MPTLEEMSAQAHELVNKYAVGCGGTAFATMALPGTSAILTAIEAKMVYDIGQIFGFRISIQEAGITAGSLVAVSGVLKHFAIEASTFVPVIGWLLKPTIAVTACKAFGKVAIQHFVNRWYEAHGSGAYA